jgi:uncharacterized protein (TIGR02466 family)
VSPEIASVLQIGLQYQQAARFQEAERAYRQVLAIAPRQAEASYLLGTLQEQLGRRDLALSLLRTALEGDPSQSRYLIALGGILIKQGGLEEALALFQTATRNYPDRAELHEKLGTLFHMKGQADEAIACYHRALVQNPNLVLAQANLGILLFQLGRTEEAIAASTRTIGLFPTHAASHANLGFALVKQGKMAEGIAALRRAVELEPRLADAHAGLVGAYLQGGDAAAAQCAAREAHGRLGFASSILGYEYHALYELGEEAAARRLVDFDRMVFAETLPVPPEFGTLAEFNTALATDLGAHPSLRWEPTGKTTRGGHQSANLVEQPTPMTRIFERMVRQKLDDFIPTLPTEPLHPFFGRKPKTYGLHMWATILDTGGHQDAHIHAAGWLSGVYYVKLPQTIGRTEQDNAGWIEFGRAPIEYPLRRAPQVKTVQPRSGLLILFPSYFFHRTIPFPAGGQRISIAFDIIA